MPGRYMKNEIIQKIGSTKRIALSSMENRTTVNLVFEKCSRTDRQTDRHIHRLLIALLRTPTEIRVLRVQVQVQVKSFVVPPLL